MFKYRYLLHSFLLLIVLQILPGPLLAGTDEVPQIVLPAQSIFSETLAAREVRRYVYLRTGQLVQKLKEVFGLQHSMVSNPGEMGMLANWNQHIIPALMTKPGEELAAALGGSLPEMAKVSMEYVGPERIFLPTLRTSIQKGEVLSLKAIFLGEKPPRNVTLFWRSLGTG